MTKENTTVNVKHFAFYISLLCTMMHFWAARRLGTHTIASLDGYLYITHIRSEKNQIKEAAVGTFYILCFKFPVSERYQVGGTGKPTHILCLQSSSATNYWPKCLVPMWAFFFLSVSALWEIISLSYNSLKAEGQTIRVWLDWKHPHNKTDYFSQWVSGTENIFYTRGSTNFCSKKTIKYL